MNHSYELDDLKSRPCENCLADFSTSAPLIKFGYSEKATEFEKIFHSKFGVSKWLQILSGRLLSNFVAFSEYPNFSSKNETLLIF